jgi:O-antigen ligase/polysaccharide polymerase Wzy-like membrane protein
MTGYAPRSLAYHRAWTAEESTLAGDRLAIGALALAFLLSYVQYIFERSDAVRVMSVVIIIAGSAAFLAVNARLRRRVLLASLLRPATLGILAAGTLPSLISSFYRPNHFPVEYGLLLILTLLSARILLTGIGFEGLMLAFFYATAIAVVIVVILNFDRLVAAMGPTRFSPLSFDPNRTAFFAVTSIPAQIWFVARRPGRKYVLLVTALCLVVTVAASSRGSIGALLIGAILTAALYVARLFKSRPPVLSHKRWIKVLTLLFFCVLGVSFGQAKIATVASSLRTKLEIDTKDRGMDSGFTGRTKNWASLFEVMPKTYWLAGNGYRTTDEDFGFPVDNGYLSSVYELGLFPTAILTAKYLLVLISISIAYVTNKSASGSSLPAVVFTLTIFLANAFVHRVFFGYGDQASLWVLFIIVSTRQDILDAIPKGGERIALPG